MVALNFEHPAQLKGQSFEPSAGLGRFLEGIPFLPAVPGSLGPLSEASGGDAAKRPCLEGAAPDGLGDCLGSKGSHPNRVRFPLAGR